MKHFLVIYFLLLYPGIAQSQLVTITGKVVDQQARGIPYATITSNPKNYYEHSNADGQFSITIERNSVASLVFTSLGYEKREIPIKDLDTSNLVVALQEASIQLNEVSIGPEKERTHIGVLGKKRLVQIRRVSRTTGQGGHEEGIFFRPEHENLF